MSKRPSEGERGSKGNSKKKSKGAGSSQQLSLAPQPPQIPKFVDDAARARFENYRLPTTRTKIVTCSYLDISTVERLHLEPVMRLFGKLSKFLHCSEIVHEQLVWEFYSNLGNIGPCLSSRIARRNFTITSDHINEAFEYDARSQPINPFYAKSWPEGFYGMDIKALTLKYFKLDWHKDIETKEFKPRYLDALPRVVYEIMWSVLAPSSGHSSEPTISQILLLYSILEKKEIDFGSFMIGYMTQAVMGTSKKDLPYGNFIMKILRHLNVPFPPSTNLIPCVILTQSFLDHKRVQFNTNTMSWELKERKRPRRPRPSEPIRLGVQGAASTSTEQGNAISSIIQNAVQAALAPILEELKAVKAELEDEKRQNSIFRVQVRDEMDVLRQGCLLGLDRTKGNKLVHYRAQLETSRIEEIGEGSKNFRQDPLDHEDEPSRPERAESSSSRTPSLDDMIDLDALTGVPPKDS